MKKQWFTKAGLRSIAIASAALCCFAAVGAGAEPNVNYAATGTFATPAVSGLDTFKLAGQPFTLTFAVNEATKPTRHSETMAEYSNITVVLTVKAGVTGGTYTYTVLGVNVFLVVGAPGKPDWFFLQIPFTFGGAPIVITAKAKMPAGTIATPAIQPFTAPVTITPRDGVATYACPACPPPYTGNSTTLAIAGGTLSATEQ